MEENNEGQKQSNSQNTGTPHHRIGRVSIFKIPTSANWYIGYSLDGKQYRPSTKTSSLKQAKELAKRKDAELVLGSAKKPSQAVRIIEAAELYAAARGRRKKETDTAKIYRRSLRFFSFFAEHRGVRRLDRVTADLLDDYEQQLSTVGLNDIVPIGEKKRRLRPQGPTSVREYLKIVRQLINWAIKRRMLSENPAPGYELPLEQGPDQYCWPSDELQRILAASEPRYRSVFDFFAMTGLRSNELCWLLKEDVSLSGRAFLHIREKCCPITGKSWKPKFGINRKVPLCPQAADIARRSIEQTAGPWLFSPGAWKRNPSGRFTSQRVLNALRQAMKRAGVKKGRIHTFRHVFCSFAANNKVPPFQVMKMLGHGSLDIVLRYYHIDEDELLSALDCVDFNRLLNPERKEGT